VQRVAPAGRKTAKLASVLLNTSTLAACIKVLQVLTSTRVLVKVLGRVLE